ncbi:hypothetical protein [Nitrosopumilus adriaticus]|uniref:hypothetical protein n=1 Tax=Nitrosopumilus adriaticus TaxID=1580092 RepID=UPI00352BE6E3
MQILGIESWIIGIAISIAGYVVPQIISKEHPIKWAPEAKIASGITVAAGIILALMTK